MFYTVAEIKEILGVGTNTAYNLVHRADFPSFRAGQRKILVRKDDFHKWLDKQAQRKDVS